MTSVADVVAAVGGKPSGSGWIGRCPCHADDNPSLSVTEAADGHILLHCHAGCSQERLVAWAKAHGLDLSGRRRKPHQPPHEVARYTYCDEHDEPRYCVVRMSDKAFFQERYDKVTGGYVGGKGCMDGVERLPFMLPELLASPDKTVWLPEGEKDALRLVREGLVASCNPGGASKWQPELCRWFIDRDVVIVPDNDQPGREHAADVAKKLHGTARRVRVLDELPGLPPKGDVSDWLDGDHDVHELLHLADAAPDWQPSQGQTGSDSSTKPDEPGDDATRERDEEEITRLAKMSEIEYERARIEAAKRLGMRVTKLDQAVEAKRAEMRGHDDAGAFPDTEPFDGLVDGADMLDGIATAIRSYLIVEKCHTDVMSLWAVFTHSFGSFEFSPKLIFSSPQHRSGKTRALEVMQRLTNRPMLTSGTNAATLLRIIDKFAPTLLLDEYDSLTKGDAEMGEALRGILNSGFSKAAAIFFKNAPAPGGGWEPRSFSTWCPQIIAGIGRVPVTVADRAIAIKMKRKMRGESIKRLRQRDGDDLRLLARKAAAWAAGASPLMSQADPKVPAQLNDRAADAWSPLLAIADAAGGDWPDRARGAALLLSGDDDEDAGGDSIAIQLLSDLRDLFDDGKLAHVSSADVVDHLVRLHERPWPEFNRGKPITQNAIARLLKPFDIRTRQVWVVESGRGRNVKAYTLADAQDAFTRYLPPLTARPLDPDQTTEKDPQSQASSGIADEKTPEDGSSGCKSEKDQQYQSSSGIADEDPQKEGRRTYAELRDLDLKIQRVIAAKLKSRTPRSQGEQRQ